MERESDPEARPDCATPGCDTEAAFFLYEADEERWRPICEPHARHRHPSIEVHAWLESGYMRPVELGEPDGPPGEPEYGRAAAFREEVEGTMGWSE